MLINKNAKPITIQSEEVYFVLNHYAESNDNRIAVTAVTADGFPYTTISINPNDFTTIDKDEIVLKNYSENGIISDYMIKEGLVNKTDFIYKTGFVKCPIVKLEEKFLDHVIYDTRNCSGKDEEVDRITL